jgi:Fis family transcriptional regulator
MKSKNKNLNLSDYTRHLIKEYLETMEGHQATDLYDFVISEIEQGLLSEVLSHFEGNQTKASKALGITRTTLRSKIRKHNLLF